MIGFALRVILASKNELGGKCLLLSERVFVFPYFKFVIPLSSDLTFVSEQKSVVLSFMSFPLLWLLWRLFYLLLVFSNFILMCFSMVCARHSRVYWAFLVCGFTAFTRFGEISAIISSNVFLFSLNHLAFFHKALSLGVFSSVFFSLYFSLDSFYCVIMYNEVLFQQWLIFY